MPLTNEQIAAWRKHLKWWDCACIDKKYGEVEQCLRCQVQELYDSEQFWRETLASNEPWIGLQNRKGEYDSAQCQWCQSVQDYPFNPNDNHKPDCPWKLAQNIIA